MSCKWCGQSGIQHESFKDCIDSTLLAEVVVTNVIVLLARHNPSWERN